MNEFEENKYLEIKEELLNNEVEKKVGNYFVNKNELSRYYNVGKLIIEAQGGETRAKYGDGLIKKYSEKLTKELGEGYSSRNLKRMRKYYLFQKGTPLVAQSISWTHFVILLSLNNFCEIEYYVNQIIKYHWSKRELQKRIKQNEYQRLDDKTKLKITKHEENKIDDYIKNPVIINIYGKDVINVTEKALKEYILHDLEHFLEELGNGFAFIKSEYKIKIGNRYNYIDLLLFNYIYNAYVVVELKVTESNKNHLGQVMVYMNYVDKYLKKEFQDKTIGIIVCRHDNKYLIEYSSDPRIRITTYELV